MCRCLLTFEVYHVLTCFVNASLVFSVPSPITPPGTPFSHSYLRCLISFLWFYLLRLSISLSLYLSICRYRSLVKSTGYLIAITAGMAAVRMTGAFAERTSYVPVFWGIVGFIAIVLPIVFVPRCGVPPARRDFYNGRTSRFAWCRMACRVGPCCSPCCSARRST